MKELERQYKALANRRRLEILKFLKTRKWASVTQIAKHLNLSLKATSKHLAVLAGINAVEKEQQSLMMCYSLSPDQESSVKHALTIIQ